MLKEILGRTLMLSALIIFVVFLISYLFLGAPEDILIVFEILLLSFLIVCIQQILRRSLFDNFLCDIIIEYITVSVFVLFYGYFFQWFIKANWWMVFLYVAAVYVPAYLLDMAVVKREVGYINAQLERRRKSESNL